MPAANIPGIPSMPEGNDPKVLREYVEQLANLVAMVFKEFDWLMSNIDSQNVRNIAGFNVGNTELKHTSGIVGMSGADPGTATAVRFWAGNAVPASAPFKVTQAGIASMVSAIIRSMASGERVVIDSTGLHSYDASGVERITIGTTPAQGAKALIGRDTSGNVQSAYTYDTSTVDGSSRTGQFITAHGAYVLIDSSGNIRLQCDTTANGEGFRARKLNRPEINDGSGWSTIAKKSEVDAKQNAFTGVNGTVYVAATSGGATTTAITFTNGVRTS